VRKKYKHALQAIKTILLQFQKKHCSKTTKLQTRFKMFMDWCSAFVVRVLHIRKTRMSVYVKSYVKKL